MFTSHSLKGRILNRALHHQHARIYNFDRSTESGSFEKPCKEMTSKFLELVHHDQGGRIYTYVLLLDGQWRFTETGKEFGIDLLSKHTMHSDVSIYIAFSGEFFVRRLSNPNKDMDKQKTHPPDDLERGLPHGEATDDPSYYELVMDNDSGTYRPNKDLLPKLKEFLEKNLPGLKIKVLDCMSDKDELDKMKKEQTEQRKEESPQRAYAQADQSSISSSDEEALDEAAGEGKQRNKAQKVAHNVAEPKDKLMAWSQGDERREKRQDEDGTAENQGPVELDITSGSKR
jgi:hypothetical protein